MSRRKGERPLAVPLDRWSDSHPVAHAIATGDRWFYAWMAQKATPISRLSKLTGIPSNRLMTLSMGDQVSRAEIDALARAWSISSGDLIESMDNGQIIVD